MFLDILAYGDKSISLERETVRLLLHMDQFKLDEYHFMWCAANIDATVKDILSEFRREEKRPRLDYGLFVVLWHSYRTVLNVCEHRAPWPMAEELLSVMRCLGLQPDLHSYRAAIGACRKASLWHRAVERLSDIRRVGLQLDLRSCRAVIDACQDASAWHRAVELVLDMVSSEVQPDNSIYRDAIGASREASLWHRALELLLDMVGSELQPSVKTVKTAMGACQKGSAWHHTLSLLIAPQAMRVDLDLLKSTLLTCDSFLDAFENRAPWHLAEDLFSEMHRLGLQPDLRSYRAAIGACRKASLWHRAVERLSDIRRVGDASAWHRAVELLLDMVGSELQPDLGIYETAIGACQEGSAWHHAMKLLIAPQAIRVDPDFVMNTNCTWVTASAWPWALELLSGMRKSVMQPLLQNYLAALSACERGSAWLQALWILTQAHPSVEQAGMVPDRLWPSDRDMAVGTVSFLGRKPGVLIANVLVHLDSPDALEIEDERNIDYRRNIDLGEEWAMQEYLAEQKEEEERRRKEEEERRRNTPGYYSLYWDPQD